MPHHCNRCKNKATHIRTNTSVKSMRYGNPYYAPKYDSWEESKHEYACEIHFEESIKVSICGPHRWKKLNANR